MQPDCHSRNSRAQAINGFDGIDTAICGHCQQLSKLSRSNICLAVAGNNAAGVEAELLRIVLAKAQLDSTDGMLWSMVLPERQNAISCNSTVKKFVRPQSTLVSISNAASSVTTQNWTDDAVVSAVRFVGGSMRRVQVPASTRSRPSWGLQQLEDNEAIIANVAKSSTLPLQSDMRLLHCTNLKAKKSDQSQMYAKQQVTTRVAPLVATTKCTAPSTEIDVR